MLVYIAKNFPKTCVQHLQCFTPAESAMFMNLTLSIHLLCVLQCAFPCPRPHRGRQPAAESSERCILQQLHWVSESGRHTGTQGPRAGPLLAGQAHSGSCSLQARSNAFYLKSNVVFQIKYCRRSFAGISMFQHVDWRLPLLIITTHLLLYICFIKE